MEDKMHFVEVFLVGFVVGAGLTYAYRGYVLREKAKLAAEAAALKASAEAQVQAAAKKV